MSSGVRPGVVLDDPIGRPASVVQALDRRDRYTGAGEHLGRTETSAASLDLAGLLAHRTVAGRGFADLVAEAFEGESELKDDLTLEGRLPRAVGALDHDVGGSSRLARVDDGESQVDERVVDALVSR